MKLLLILGTDDNYSIISASIEYLGFNVIRYHHVLKAMDNIDEIDPAAVIISAKDFPMHWKILVQFIRSERSKELCPIILLKGEHFSAEESSKAFFLGVNGIVSDTLEHNEDTDQLCAILGRRPEAPRALASRAPIPQRRFFIEPWHNIGLLIGDLWGTSIIIGDVKTISAGGLTFDPISREPIDESILKRELHECSLRAGDDILSPVCRINGAGKTISAEFISFPHNEQHLLNQYLQTI